MAETNSSAHLDAAGLKLHTHDAEAGRPVVQVRCSVRLKLGAVTCIPLARPHSWVYSCASMRPMQRCVHRKSAVRSHLDEPVHSVHQDSISAHLNEPVHSMHQDSISADLNEPVHSVHQDSVSLASVVTSSKKGAGVWYTSGATQAIQNAGVSWVYDWTSTPGAQALSIPSGVEFVPQVSCHSHSSSALSTGGLDALQQAGNGALCPISALLLYGELWDLLQSNSWPGHTLCILSVAWPASGLFEEPILCARAPLPALEMLRNRMQSKQVKSQAGCVHGEGLATSLEGTLESQGMHMASARRGCQDPSQSGTPCGTCCLCAPLHLSVPAILQIREYICADLGCQGCDCQQPERCQAGRPCDPWLPGA